jgi:hypothetical protein
MAQGLNRIEQHRTRIAEGETENLGEATFIAVTAVDWQEAETGEGAGLTKKPRRPGRRKLPLLPSAQTRLDFGTKERNDYGSDFEKNAVTIKANSTVEI